MPHTHTRNFFCAEFISIANLPLTLRKYDAAAHTPCIKLHPALCRSLVIFVLDPAICLLARRRTAYARGASPRRRSTALFLMPTAGAIFRNPGTLFLVNHLLFPPFVYYYYYVLSQINLSPHRPISCATPSLSLYPVLD